MIHYYNYYSAWDSIKPGWDPMLIMIILIAQSLNTLKEVYNSCMLCQAENLGMPMRNPPETVNKCE